MSTTTLVQELVDDLEAEVADAVTILDGLERDPWMIDTPAAGWTVGDQIAHLAHFDSMTAMAVGDPAGFETFRDRLEDLQTYVDGIGATVRHLDAAGLLAWWLTESERLRQAALEADPTKRVPWFGQPMSLQSKLTARIMETWAHGQDVADALGVTRTPTDRLRHVVRIGYLAFANSYRTRGLEAPETVPSVSLLAPDGVTRWELGQQGAAQQVMGSALDFSLVVTQRRHVSDTAIVTTGSVAEVWMQIAQAFAGPPGEGRSPEAVGAVQD